MCVGVQEVFGITAATVNARVAFSNNYFGGINLQCSRVLSVGGSIDPWHALSVLSPPNPDEPVRMAASALFPTPFAGM